MTLAVRDWRLFDDGVDGLVATEARAWLEQLHWDVSEPWSVIEPARRAGRLPGLVSLDRTGAPTGWSAFLPHAGHLQVMSIVAPDVCTASGLVDGILASDESRSAQSTIVCVRDGTPGLFDVLSARGFAVERYRYLSVEFGESGERVDGVRLDALPTGRLDRPGASADCHHGLLEPWVDHGEQMADLCARAYRDTTSIRAFAAGGTTEEWRHYVASLTNGTGCGWFAPELSAVLRHDGAAAIHGAIMMTDLGPSTVHVAQMAVDPAIQGRGVGRALLSAALLKSAPLFARATLLVAASNHAAVALYESFGFRDSASFIVAERR